MMIETTRRPALFLFGLLLAVGCPALLFGEAGAVQRLSPLNLVVPEMILTPANPTPGQTIDADLFLLQSCSIDDVGSVSVQGQLIEIHFGVLGLPVLCPQPSFQWRLVTLGPLAAGTYGIKVFVGDELQIQRNVAVDLPTRISLQDGAFGVTLGWGFGGESPTRAAPGWPVSDQSGYFTFFDPQNAEVTVKILDGRTINGHWWVFVASMTELPFELRIEEVLVCVAAPCPPGRVRIYSSGSGNRNFIDLAAF